MTLLFPRFNIEQSRGAEGRKVNRRDQDSRLSLPPCSPMSLEKQDEEELSHHASLAILASAE